MKKLLVSLVAVMAVSAANAAIVSDTAMKAVTGDKQYTSTNYIATGDTLTVAAGKLDTAVKANANAAGAAQAAADANAGSITTLQGTVAGHTTSIEALETKTADMATTGDVDTAKQEAIAAAKTAGDQAYAGKDTEGVASGAATKAAANETAIATLNTTVAGHTTSIEALETKTTDMATTGDVDTAKQEAIAAAKTAGDQAYAKIGTEQVAADNASAIGTLTTLTTDSKNTLVAAINEVDANANAAQSAANTNAGKISTLETTVGDSTSGLVADVAANTTAISGKADKATTLAGYGITDSITKVDADAAYAVKGTEDVASGAAAKAATNETAIGTLTSLTTDSKNTLVAAINEVDANANAAQSAATEAQGTADEALDKAQAAIPAPSSECTADESVKCVLTAYKGAQGLVYGWEVVDR